MYAFKSNYLVVCIPADLLFIAFSVMGEKCLPLIKLETGVCWIEILFNYLCIHYSELQVLNFLFLLLDKKIRSRVYWKILQKNLLKAIAEGPIYKYGDLGQKYFWIPLSPQTKNCGWLVDWLEHSFMLVGWVQFNRFMLTQQFTTNIACIVETVYIFNRNYNLKTK